MLSQPNNSQKKPFSLRWKLVIPLILLGLIAIIAFTLVITHTLLQELAAQKLNSSEQLAHSIDHIANLIADTEELQTIITAISHNEEMRVVLVVEKKSAKIIATNQEIWLGKTIAYLELLKLSHPLKSPPSAWITQFEQLSDYCNTSKTLTNNTVSQINRFNNAVIHCGEKNIVFMLTDTSAIYQLVYITGWWTLLWSFILIGTIIGLVYLLFDHVVLHPIRLIEQAIMQRSKGNKSVYVPLVNNDEIGIMANALNTMLIALDLSQAETKKLALVAKCTDNIVIISDNLGRVEWVNDGFTRITGYTLEEVRGIKPGDVLQGHGTDQKTVETIRRSLQRGYGFQVEILNYKKDGTEFWVAMEIQPIRDDDGHITQFIAIERDITERKQVETVLRQAEERFRTLIEASDDWTWEIDEYFVYTYASPKVSYILGYSQNEVIGKTPCDFMLPVEAERVRAILIEIAKNYKPFEYLEHHVKHKNGHLIVCETTGIPIFDKNGIFKGYRGIDRDITMRHKTYELSLANAELARTSRLKDEFLANMSHELRTPLNAILSLSEGLQEQVYGHLNDKQLKFLRSIETSGRHLLSLINDILDLSKIEAGKLELDIGPVDLNDICQASLEFVKYIAHKKHIKIHSHYDSLANIIKADERRLKQILVNLLSNAVKFTEENGEIGLETNVDKIKKIVEITIWDTGIGIAEEDKGILFKPFVQIDSSLARRHGGTGLGLALVRRLTEKHDGTVTVESKIGKGSCFTIALPWSESLAQKISTETPQDKQIITSPKCTDYSPLILLAEDNQDNINAVSSYLQFKGYRLMIAHNGLEAIEQACSTMPDVILMDIQMPVMNGLEAIKQIRTYPNLRYVPIIALTALAMPGDRERCITMGANRYMSKPVDLKQLIRTIEMIR